MNLRAAVNTIRSCIFDPPHAYERELGQNER